MLISLLGNFVHSKSDEIIENFVLNCDNTHIPHITRSESIHFLFHYTFSPSLGTPNKYDENEKDGAISWPSLQGEINNFFFEMAINNPYYILWVLRHILWVYSTANHFRSPLSRHFSENVSIRGAEVFHFMRISIYQDETTCTLHTYTQFSKIKATPSTVHTYRHTHISASDCKFKKVQYIMR